MLSLSFNVSNPVYTNNDPGSENIDLGKSCYYMLGIQIGFKTAQLFDDFCC